MKKINIVYILLGIGIGIILTSIFFYINPLVKYAEYTDEEIKEKAKDLGMVSIKEFIKDNGEKEDYIIEFKISSGDTLSDIANNLIDLSIIEDKEEFIKFVKDKKLDKKLRPGTYKLKPNLSYSSILEILSNN